MSIKSLILVLLSVIAVVRCGEFCPYLHVNLTVCTYDSQCQALNSIFYCQPTYKVCVSGGRSCATGEECYREGNTYECRKPQGANCNVGTDTCFGNTQCLLSSGSYKCKCPVVNNEACSVLPGGECATGKVCWLGANSIYGYCMSSKGSVCDADSDCTGNRKCHNCRCTDSADFPPCKGYSETLRATVPFENAIREWADPAYSPGIPTFCSLAIPELKPQSVCCRGISRTNEPFLRGINLREGNWASQVVTIDMEYFASNGWDCQYKSYLSETCGMNLY